MLFQIHYRYNPLAISKQYYMNKGNYLLNNAKGKLKRYLNHDKRISLVNSCKQAIHGLSFLYNFKYHKFLRTNLVFTTKNTWIKQNHHRHCLTTKLWIKLIVDLNQQCLTIQHYPNISSLLRSKYHHYIMIDGIQHFYHPRKHQFVKNKRTKLSLLGNNTRHHFAGNFVRFGSKPNGQLTILLINIYYKGTLITKHLWFNATKGFKSLGNLNVGDIITFDARVKTYRKGYLPNSFRKRYDYELSYPTHIHVIHI